LGDILSGLALAVALVALGLSWFSWRRQFRPIVSAAVRTKAAGNEAVIYELVLLNSGSNPARDVSITTDKVALEQYLGLDATGDNRTRWLACFEADAKIDVLQNGDHNSCSFGHSRRNNSGFWKYGSKIDVCISYKDWFGRRIVENQSISIRDSESFTGFSWGERHGYGGERRGYEETAPSAAN
jgi:hypothetical protein